MIDANSETAQPLVALQGQWSDREDVPQVYVDEAVLQYVNQRIYLSLGQIQVLPSSATTLAEAVEIRPVARIVLTESSFQKIMTMLNEVARRIEATSSSKGEE